MKSMPSEGTIPPDAPTGVPLTYAWPAGRPKIITTFALLRNVAAVDEEFSSDSPRWPASW